MGYSSTHYSVGITSVCPMSGSMPVLTQPIPAKARTRADRLINLDDFYTHVRHCRWAFGVGLAVAIVGQVLRMPNMAIVWRILSPAKWNKGWWMVEAAVWISGAILLVSHGGGQFCSSRF